MEWYDSIYDKKKQQQTQQTSQTQKSSGQWYDSLYAGKTKQQLDQQRQTALQSVKPKPAPKPQPKQDPFQKAETEVGQFAQHAIKSVQNFFKPKEVVSPIPQNQRIKDTTKQQPNPILDDIKKQLDITRTQITTGFAQLTSGRGIAMNENQAAYKSEYISKAEYNQAVRQQKHPTLGQSVNGFLGQQIAFAPAILLGGWLVDPITANLASKIPEGTNILTNILSLAMKGGIKAAPYGALAGTAPAKTTKDRLLNTAVGVATMATLGIGVEAASAVAGELVYKFGQEATDSFLANKQLIYNVVTGKGTPEELATFNKLNELGLTRQAATSEKGISVSQTTQKKGMVWNVLRFMFSKHFEPTIKKPGETSTTEQKQTQEQLQLNNVPEKTPQEATAYVKDNFNQAITDYSKRAIQEYGTDNVISADEAKYVIPGFKGTNANNYHEASSTLANDLYTKKLEDNKGQGNNTVLFSAGGTGSGKTTSLNTAGIDYKDYPIVYDSTLSSGRAEKRIQDALDNGYKVEIAFIQRDPIEAFQTGVLPRMVRTGRAVPASAHITTHTQALQKVLDLKEKFGNKIEVAFIDNTRGAGKAQVVSLENLPKFSYTKDELQAKIYETINKAEQKGSISKDQATALRSTDRGVSQQKRQEKTSTTTGLITPSPTLSEKPEKDPSQAQKEDNSISGGVGEGRGSTTLHSEVIPGLSSFIEGDVKESVKVLKDAGVELKTIVNPPAASKRALSTADTIREAKAKIVNESEVEAWKYKKYESLFNKQGKQKGIENISEYERTGKVTNAPKGYSEFYKQTTDNAWEIMRSVHGEDKVGYVENYVRRIFKFGSKSDQQKGTAYLANSFQKSLSASKAPLKSRVLDMPLDEALTNMQQRGIKVEMATTNMETLRQWTVNNAKRAAAFAEVWNQAKLSKNITFVGVGDKIPEDMIKLNDRVAEVFYPTDKGLVKSGQYYATPDVARIFNNAISKGLEESATYQGIRMIENTMNQFNLGISAFHLTGTAINAGISDVAVGVRSILEGNFPKGVLQMGRGIVPFASFANDYYRTTRLFDGLKNNNPEAYAFLEQKLNPAGGRLLLDRQWRIDAFHNMTAAFLKGNIIGAAIRLPSAVVEVAAKPIMEYAVPRVKVGAFMDLAEASLKQLGDNANQAEKNRVLAMAWDSIDNRFGQVVYDNLFWNKVGKDLALFSTRSVGWNLGTIREIGGGVVDVKKIATGKGISDRTIYSMILPLYVGTIGAVYMYLHTGKTPKTFKDYFYPQNGLTDKYGNADRSSMPTYMKDVFAYTQDPVGTILNKTSPLIATVAQLINNRNYYGDLIKNPNDPVGKQFEQTGSYIAQNVLPFSMQQLFQQQKEGASTEQKLESFFGFTKAPAAITKSQAQKDIANIRQKTRGLYAPRTPEQVNIQNTKTQVQDDIYNKKKTYTPKQLVDMGLFSTTRSARTFIKNSHLSPMKRSIKSLPKKFRKQVQSEVGL